MKINSMGIQDQNKKNGQAKAQIRGTAGNENGTSAATGGGAQFVDKMSRLLFRNNQVPVPSVGYPSGVVFGSGINPQQVYQYGSNNIPGGLINVPSPGNALNFSFNASSNNNSNSNSLSSGGKESSRGNLMQNVSHQYQKLQGNNVAAYFNSNEFPESVSQEKIKDTPKSLEAENVAKSFQGKSKTSTASKSQKAGSYSTGGPYGGAKRGAGVRKRKRVVPHTGGGARAVRVPEDKNFAIGLEKPIVECLRNGGRNLNSLENQKLKDATSLLQEMQCHILEPLTLYSSAELYDLMASIAETWKNSGKAAWKKRINKIKENARGRKAPRNQLDPAEIQEINSLNERIRIRENWEKKEKQKIELEKRLEKRAMQQADMDRKAKESKGKKNKTKSKRSTSDKSKKKAKSGQAKSTKNDKGRNNSTSVSTTSTSQAMIKGANNPDFVPGVDDIATILSMASKQS